MRMTCRLPDHAAVVEALLEGFVRACQVCLEAGLAPADPAEADVRYKLEPAGEEDWKLPQNVVRDGWGDCEDLAGWRAAGLRMSGEDPEARVVVARTGANKLHAVVQRSNGEVDDPSLELFQRQKATMLGAKVIVRDHRTNKGPVPKGATVRTSSDGTITYKRDYDPVRDAPPPTVAARARAATKAIAEGSDPRSRDFGKGTRTVFDASNPEAAAAQGFRQDQATGAWSRMTAAQRDDYQQYGVDPTGQYDGEADAAAERAELEAEQYGEYAYNYGGYGGSFGADYDQGDEGGWQSDGSWVDPRAVAAFSARAEPTLDVDEMDEQEYDDNGMGDVRSPTSTRTEVRSPTRTSTRAHTSGNVTVTGGAGAGATTVNIAARDEDEGWM